MLPQSAKIEEAFKFYCEGALLLGARASLPASVLQARSLNVVILSGNMIAVSELSRG